MRAFLSRSSADRDIVIAVHDALEKWSTWIDRAEIECDLFLEKISEDIAPATDFVLFWSSEAARSQWVRLEINVAFIQLLQQRAIRLRIISLDHTPLPLYLRPFQVFSVATVPDPAKEIVDKLERRRHDGKFAGVYLIDWTKRTYVISARGETAQMRLTFAYYAGLLVTE